MIEPVLPFDLLELVVQLDALILSEDYSDSFFILLIKDGVYALHFGTGDEHQLMGSFF